VLTTSRGPLRTRHPVDAAGLYADGTYRFLGNDVFTVTPRRGQLIVLDKQARDLVGHILLPVPGPAGKGVLAAPTVFGSDLLGPTRPPPADPSLWRPGGRPSGWTRTARRCGSPRCDGGAGPRQGMSSRSAPTAATSPAPSSQLPSRVRPFLLSSITTPQRMSASP